MEDGLLDAVRAVVNFARLDERYARLVNQPEERMEYFGKAFDDIAERCGVDSDELRAFLLENMPAENFGLRRHVRRDGSEALLSTGMRP